MIAFGGLQMTAGKKVSMIKPHNKVVPARISIHSLQKCGAAPA